MSRFNRARPRVPTSPVRSTGARTRTAQGGDGHLRDPRSELFLLAVTHIAGEDTFYERAERRDDRYARLVRTLAVEDPVWTGRLLTWLRGEAHLRTAALVGAAEFTAARLERQAPGHSRQVVDAVLQRADEPGEMLGHWTSVHGRALPKPVKRGVADAVRRLYDERALLAYDTPAHAFRFGDVLNLVHPSPAADRPWQGELFRHALDRRGKRDTAIPERLGMLRARDALARVPVAERRTLLTAPGAAERLRAAGMTWEALAGWLQGPMDARAWEAVIPSMGYMALLRNLRNFDEAGVDDEVAARVAERIADPDRVARSRQLPLRFYSAFNAAPSLRWGHALEKALGASLAAVPRLPGRTLVLVDTSSSMNEGFSRDGTLMRWDAAALFGIALGRRCERADVVSFSSARRTWNDPPRELVRPFVPAPGGSLLGDVRRWREGGWFLGGGTDTAPALRATFRGHDRVVVVTDEQAGHDAREVTDAVPARTPMYTWNLAGYAAGHAPSGQDRRHTFGGLTDQAFRMIPMIEAGRDAVWPWEDPGRNA
ncbi:TROVE domain-containing protein [Streptomyces sp. NPDC059783]|uniref:TROVE domain-containing protein n=1 Tax=Streptomyces sp. NPDC059783 TaxID=3346944 RepID=UPI00364A2EA1